eukprot:scaffold19_cov114-Cylindrotheca_fusiformis.AAC.21
MPALGGRSEGASGFPLVPLEKLQWRMETLPIVFISGVTDLEERLCRRWWLQRQYVQAQIR